MFDHARTRRPVRTERRAARNRAPDLRRGARASAPGARGLRRIGARHDRARLRPEMAARGHLVDAQGALPHHARLHAEKGPARPRHDAAHLHRADQPRLPIRSRHGQKVPGQPGVAAGGGGAVRQFAVCRGQAVGAVEPAQPGVDRHRPRPLRHLAVRLRSRVSGSSAMSTTCSTCRCISSTATAATSTRAGSRSAISWPAGCRRCPAKSRAWATGSTI